MRLTIKICILCVSSLYSLVSYADDNAAGCWQRPTIIKETSGLSINALSKTDHDMIANNSGGAIVPYEGDINNDGKNEVAFTVRDPKQNGTTGNLAVYIFEKTAQGYKFLGQPPIEGDNSLINSESFDNTGGAQVPFLIQLCGKTYMRFGYTDSYPDTYILENNKIQSACDNNYAQYQRANFQKLYATQQFYNAYAQLNFYLDRCEGKIQPPLSLWMQNDLALAALKIGNNARCNTILQTIEKDPGFSQASDGLKKAVAFNQKMCPAPLATDNQTKVKSDFSWLLSKKALDPHNGYPLKKLFATQLNELIKQTTPNIKMFDLLYYEKEYYKEIGYNEHTTLFKIMNDYISNANYISTAENRYAWVLGFRDNVYGGDDENAPFIWVDTQTGESMVGFTRDSDGIYITSKNYSPANTPAAFKHFIYNSIKHSPTLFNNGAPPIVFFDTTKNKAVYLPGSWLKQ